MNSVYKRYLTIAVAALLLAVCSMVSNVSGLFAETDHLNAYVEDNGTTEGFHFDKLMHSMHYENEETEDYYVYPDFLNFSLVCRDNDGNTLWYVILAVVTALFYLYEKGSSTADFCAVLPIKKRSGFAFKLGLLVMIALAMLAVNVWSIYMYNIRVSACNETYKILGLTNETVSTLGYDFPELISRFTVRLCTISIFMFLAEVTNRAYLAPCIFVLATFAICGTLTGLYSYISFYFDVTPNGFGINLRYIYGNSVTAFVQFVIAVLIGLWGGFLSGRGDLSRKGSVFRFKWVENIAMLCIVVCAAFCSFEMMYLWEINYSIGVIGATAIMLFVGAVAYFVSRRISLLLGR